MDVKKKLAGHCTNNYFTRSDDNLMKVRIGGGWDECPAEACESAGICFPRTDSLQISTYRSSRGPWGTVDAIRISKNFPMNSQTLVPQKGWKATVIRLLLF